LSAACCSMLRIQFLMSVRTHRPSFSITWWKDGKRTGERLLVGNVVHQKNAHSTTVVGSGNGAEALLQEEHAGKTILTSGYYQKLIGMVQAMRVHPWVRDWQRRFEGVEVTCIGKIKGVPFKGRFDAMTDEPLVDAKKWPSDMMELRQASRHALSMGYIFQAAVYCLLSGRSEFVILAVEDKPPFDYP